MQNDLPTLYQTFIHRSRYSRWNDARRRREIWPETVDRYMGFMLGQLQAYHDYQPTENDGIAEIRDSIIGLQTMPSMRCLMTAGRALERDNICGYNCAYLPINSPRSFDELLFILMCGTGVGFSVERQFISELPPVPDVLQPTDETLVVPDSKRGWAESFRHFLSALWDGRILKWDVSNVRSAGSRLKTMGGRASGPGPLVELFQFSLRLFDNARGRKLNSLECHDLACKVGDCVVMGGVRRSALISLSNLSDLRMRDAKTGQWWVEHPYRALANNSVAYTDGRPDVGRFMSEWLALYQSKSGERGIFNREAARRQAVKNSRRSSYPAFGTNPCNEIILRARQFCNLSEVVARPDDTFDTLARKVRIATILGTWQSTLTKFRYISRDFARNCEEERLLGVSVTGVMDCPLLNNTSEHTREVWQELKNIAIQTNYCWSDRLSINRSVAITCIKPSGTVSQLVGSSSGIHPCHAPFYIRRVRQDKRDPLSTFLIDRGFPWETDQLKEGHLVFSFPMRGAQGSIYRDDITAIDHLKLWQFINENWCEHKPSITVSVKEHEWPGVGSWVWEHFDELSGVSFLPHSEHNYTQAPFEAVDQTRLEQMEERMPRRVDWSLLSNYELEDHTTGTQELACSSGQCEI